MSRNQVVVTFPTYREKYQKYVALGHVTVCKGPFKELSKPFLNGIGGALEKGETPEEAAWREFKEEVVLHNGSTIPSELVRIGQVSVYFREEDTPTLPESFWGNESREPDVELHVFRMYLPKKMDFTPRGDPPEFESFAWYPLRNITYPGIGPNGAELLPSDRFWLPTFLTGKGERHAEIEINHQFQVHEFGIGEEYTSGRMWLSEQLEHPP